MNYKSYLIPIILILLILQSCSKDTNFENTNFNMKSDSYDILSLDEVLSQLESSNCIQIDSEDYTKRMDPNSGYTSFKLYENSITGELFEIYIWDDTSVLIDAINNDQTECYHVFYDNNDCKDDGNQCQVTIEDGEIKTTLCCEEQEAPIAK